MLQEPGPVWALVQFNPKEGPLRRLRSWDSCANPQDAGLLDLTTQLNPIVVEKTLYGARNELPLNTLSLLEKAFAADADTDARVLATSVGLFDAGVPVVVRSNLCLSIGRSGERLHYAALDILGRQL